MSAWSHVFDMGGYAMYVWPAYGLVFMVLISNLVALRRQRLRTFKKLQQWFKRAS